ncbi:hypothetical protein [Actinomadura rupiterrae]|uniref:hypothetical protein n=1 Tax=Actinomadura rupiterrae TaxID=559627 RepID=UPI0020A2B90F|nr:hypothetical protein [Actinomadura rupiterrae]MCP2337040.1 hypothetical protein [Actinomadura rupiterrae]
MFWRKQRRAFESLHPLHRQLVEEHRFSATLPAAEWSALVASLASHEGTITRRRWRLPRHAPSVLVPMIRILQEDMEPGGALGVSTDLRGPNVPEKRGPSRQLNVRYPVRRGSETLKVDPWLLLRAELRDGSVLDVAVVERVRERRFTKTSRSGKTKHKSKTKTVRVVQATRRLPKGMAVRQPAQPPPPWLAVRVQQKENGRAVLRASAKLHPVADVQTPGQILTVTGELFRWTPAASAPSAASPRRTR